MENYAIIGGAGFIGSNYTKYLLKRGNKVKIYDNFSSGKEIFLENYLKHPSLEIIEGKAEDTEKLSKILKDTHTVIHLASNPDIAAAMNNPTIDFYQGTALTSSVLEAGRLANIKKFIYASGSGVFGEYKIENLKEDDISNIEPISTYGASKLAGEALVSSYAHMYNIQSYSFRFANVVGPFQTHGVTYDFIKKLLKDPSNLLILGDGTQTKSYIYVNDVIEGIETAILNTDKIYDVHNISTLDTISVKEIAEICLKTLNIDKRDLTFKYTGGERGWKGDVPKISISPEKLIKKGWMPSYNSHQAIILSCEHLFKRFR